jgi:penicillin-binding protein 1C
LKIATKLRQYRQKMYEWFRTTPQRFGRMVRRYPYRTGAIGCLLLLWLFCLPRPLFDAPFSPILLDRDGQLLGARIATDGQWRFPERDSVPDKYRQCLLTFEDKRFYWHPGVDPISLGRALWLNARSGQRISGGSTLTMQVIRMARGNPPRTLWQKLLEMCMATRLELTHSKQHILALYAAHAPFGGNVVGLEAASWRYYAKRAEALSWAEAATLAVLPNSPALIHPGRRREALLAKRNRVLARLRDAGTLTAFEYELAASEPLPAQPHPLPQLAPHLLDKFSQAADNQALSAWFARSEVSFFSKKNNLNPRTSIDRGLQERVTEILVRRQEQYRGNGIHNLAAVVIDVPTGEVLAYIGNVPQAGKEHSENVDVVTAPRSTGSILKPYLYALSLESGDILPRSLLFDVPTQLGQYRPENYYETYDGMVPAHRALIRSLNVPFVLLLQQHGLEKFHFELQKLGITTLRKPAEHYGLSLILGGAEASLLDITNTYACMARRLGAFYDRNGRAAADDFRPPRFSVTPAGRASAGRAEVGGLSSGAIWHTFAAMQDVERPNSLGEWEMFRASRRIAWKTGTSFGFRDAWAAGVNARYAVGVWVGNADGEGRPGLIGVDMAAPVLFEIFGQLPGGDAWFDPPYDDMAQVSVCRQSGFRAGEYCERDTTWIPKSGLRAAACPYHDLLHLDSSAQWQVTSACVAPSAMLHRPWFVLPPSAEFYFRAKNPTYQPPPPFRSDCADAAQVTDNQRPMQFIYPRQMTRIYVPTDLDGSLGSTVFQATHRAKDAEIFWHLDGNYLGSTRTFHQMALQPSIGQHTLTLVDKDGFRLEQVFEVVGK